MTYKNTNSLACLRNAVPIPRSRTVVSTALGVWFFSMAAAQAAAEKFQLILPVLEAVAPDAKEVVSKSEKPEVAESTATLVGEAVLAGTLPDLETQTGGGP